MLVLLFYILPIILVCFIAYCDMEHGQTLNEYVNQNDFEMPAVFTFVPIINLLVASAAIGMIIWNFVSNFRKP